MVIELENLEFRATFAGSYRRFFTVGILGPMSIAGCLLYAFQIFPERLQNEGGNLVGAIAFLALVVGLGSFVWLFYFLPMVREFWQSHFFINLTNEMIVGENLWKQRTRVPYARIVEIRREPSTKLRAIPAGLDLLSSTGEIIRLHPNIENFGDCVQAIRVRCQNIDAIDYGGIDNNASIWQGKNKM